MKKITFLNFVPTLLILALTTVGIEPVLAKTSGGPALPQQAVSHAPVCHPGQNQTESAYCHSRVVTDRSGNPAMSGGPSGLSPQQLRNAYNLSGLTFSGANRVVAIVDAYDDPNVFNDLTTYSNTFSISPTIRQCNAFTGSPTSPCFQKINQRGTSTPPKANAGWGLEISLDVQAVRAICPQCSILLVEADSNSYANLFAAVDRAVSLGATIISNSYGSSEFSGETSYDSHFNRSGIAFTFSSGDNGYGAEYPAASPYVTAVGGTKLTMNGTIRVSETAWSGAGSGCSQYESLPSYQTSDNTCTHRKIADVSAVADPATGASVYDSFRYQGQAGWFTVGGTSLAAPVIAGVYALAGPSTFSGLRASSLPYSNTSSLNDIISGSNGSCGGTYLCTAGTNYDGPTGLGTPAGIGAF